MRPVFVTGVGVASPVGNDGDTFWANLVNGRCGLTVHDVGGPVVCGTVDCDTSALAPKWLDRTSAAQQMAFVVADAALRGRKGHGGFPREDAMVIVGSGGINVPELLALGDGGWRSYGRTWPSRGLPNAIASFVASQLGVQGPAHTVTTACCSSTDAIGLAFESIQAGRCDAALVIGVESWVTPETVSAFRAIGALSPVLEPEAACRPFHEKRSGMVVADGAGAIVLEADAASSSFAEITGYAATGDAGNAVAPRADGKVLRRAIKRCLSQMHAERQAKPSVVFAHGTGTRLGDQAELTALRAELAGECFVTAPKAAIGHTSGASGILESIAAVYAVSRGVVPGTHNVPDSRWGALSLLQASRETGVAHALKVSAGFGGHNAVIGIGRTHLA